MGISRMLVLCGLVFVFSGSRPEAFATYRTTTTLGHGSQSSCISDGNAPLRSDFQNQPAFSTVDLDGALLVSSGEGQVVAVVDGGFDLGHEAIDGSRVVGTWDFVDGDGDPSEHRDGIDQDGEDGPDSMFGHGTAVASLAMEMAPGARFLLYRVMDEEGTTNGVRVASAIDLAVVSGATEINVSIVFPRNDLLLQSSIAAAVTAGVVVVAPSGNGDGLDALWPAALTQTACVGSSSAGDGLLDGTINGPLVDLLAPGEKVVVAYHDSPTGYAFGSGTSFSCPFVTAAAALLRSVQPGLSPYQVRNALCAAADELPLTPEQEEEGICGRRLNMEKPLQ